MGQPLLTTGATIACPHLGSAQAVSQSLRVRAAGQPILTLSNGLVVTGCPLNISGSPVPCTQVTWQMGSARVRSAGQPVLTSAAQGLSVGAAGPQGPPQIQATQMRAKAM